LQQDAWKNETLVRSYLEGVRGAIPFAKDQADVILRLFDAAGLAVRAFADIGCGDGFLGALLLDRYPAARGVFVDYSEPMLAAARERLAPHRKRATVRQGDLSRAAWMRATDGFEPLDAVVSGYAIHHLPDERKRALYAEVLGLLAPGAFFINVEHVSSPTPWLTEVFDEALIDAYYAHHRAAGRDVSREEIAREYVRRPDREANVLASVEAQCDWLRDAGYQDVDCYFKYFELAVFGGRKPGA
jgi:trans-aconitate methyltransferase